MKDRSKQSFRNRNSEKKVLRKYNKTTHNVYLIDKRRKSQAWNKLDAKFQ